MALQNRVDPFGEIVAHPARGLFMGNRGGRIHTQGKQLSNRRWASHHWICCVTEFRGWRREVMGAGYTELFFLDEATALAAGHRPCAFCRRGDFERFVEAWARGAQVERPRSVDVIDRALHAERAGPGRQKAMFTAKLADLPAGTFVTFEETPARAYLTWAGRLFPWSFEGYGEPIAGRPGLEALVLTPRSIVGALGAGYEPKVALPPGNTG